jgi:hypothetical protein
MRRGLWVLLLWSAAAGAAAMEEDDSAALALPSAPVAPAASARTTSVTLEGAETTAQQVDGPEQEGQRLSADARYDSALGRGWRAVAALRLDADWANRFDSVQEIGTLKEAYVSWQPQANLLLDAGRINGRQGVAYGYNPTDFFRTNAIRSIVSVDPNSLRDNRLGTVMLRGQQLWDSGALSVVYAPRLTEHASAAPLDPDIGATNARGRWLLSFSQQLTSGWTPQWLAFGGAGQSPQLGVNLTALLGQSMVAYAEVSGGRSSSLWSQALNLPQTASWRSRAATGLTYSTTSKLSFTLEYEYNGAGLGTIAWDRARRADPRNLQRYGRYREYALAQQDTATRSNLFLYATWQDLIVRHLDLSAFLRQDLADYSRLPYLELRRHWTALDLAVRWQDAWGDGTSDYGASPQRQTWQFVIDYYL